MKNVLKVTKYQISDFLKPITIYYTIIFLLSLFITIQFMRMDNKDGSFGAFGSATVIFIFIAGLNCFRSSFKFTMINNLSRRTFYLGNIIAIASLAIFMAVMEAILNTVLKLKLPYLSMLEQLYRQDSFMADFAWSFGVFFFFVCLGWLINMIYYRANKFTRILVSLSPIFVMILIGIVDDLTEGALISAIGDFLRTALGLSLNPYNLNPYIGFVSFTIGAIGLLALSFLLIRRMPVKD